MDSHLENKFMGVEKAYIEKYKEKEISMASDIQNTDDFKAQVFDSFVVEKTILIGYIHDLINFVENGATLESEGASVNILTDEDAFNVKTRVVFIISKYQEQPELLDSILSKFLSPMISYLQKYLRERVKGSNPPYQISTNLKNIFDIVYNMSKVRGMKTVIKFFPHDVEDLEILVDFIINIQLSSSEWYVHYVLLLWLSMVVIVPFDLETIDSKMEGEESLLTKIINFCENFLKSTGVNREASCKVIAKILTRPDVIKEGHLDAFIEEMKTRYHENINNSTKIFILTGILQVLCEIFKTGQRDDLKIRIEAVFDTFVKTKSTSDFVESSSMLKKLRVKFVHKLGLIYLKPRVASWRYKMGSRSLLENLKLLPKESEEHDTGFNYDENEEDDDMEEINSDLETIISILLEHLKDPDTSIRWAAAKGIGKITGRLTLEFADQIVEEVLQCFDENETDSSWQGGCLALAELCRGGLLLPARLVEVVPKIKQALLYDVNRGNRSVGAHVRDAACYVVWSFARSFIKDIMRPHVESLSTHLCIMFLFDREVNCRRAASAAFQE
jgi:tubulin-specific chaperone D